MKITMSGSHHLGDITSKSWNKQKTTLSFTKSRNYIATIYTSSSSNMITTFKFKKSTSFFLFGLQASNQLTSAYFVCFCCVSFSLSKPRQDIFWSIFFSITRHCIFYWKKKLILLLGRYFKKELQKTTNVFNIKER